uniref:stress-induced-phosphoprotein 1-like n=1 Tax=Styela clava TaxID=7725 RepID=UPI0019393650|nr:stress-induced-phosphoprotein 1-like [Styela clava]
MADNDADLAIAEKDMGNSFYKKRAFKKALECYDRAIKLDATNAIFFTNKAAVYYEQGELEKCRENCLKAVDVGLNHGADIALIAKAYGRIGSSYMKEKNHSEAKHFFAISLSKNKSSDVMEKLVQCEKEIEEVERLAYINPELAQEEYSKGCDEFAAKNFEIALNHFTEAIKRNPDDAKTYLTKAAVHMTLLQYDKAVEDCEECVKKDASLVKGYIYKGAALESLCEYDKAMDAYQKSLELDPNVKEVTEAYHRCLNKDYEARNTSNLLHSRAKENTDIAEILSDTNESDSIRKLINNPNMTDKVQRLIDYGLIKLS